MKGRLITASVFLLHPSARHTQQEHSEAHGGGGGDQVTGFIPAGEGQYMQMCVSSGLPLTMNSSELMKGKVQRKRYGTSSQAGRLGSRGAWTLHHRRSQRRASTRKDTARFTFGANFLALWWVAEEGKREQGGIGWLLKPSGRWSHQDLSHG